MAAGVPCPRPRLAGRRRHPGRDLPAGSSLWLRSPQAGPAFLLTESCYELSHAGYLEFKPNRFGELMASEVLRSWHESPTRQGRDWSFGCMAAKSGASTGTWLPSELERGKENLCAERRTSGLDQICESRLSPSLPFPHLFAPLCVTAVTCLCYCPLSQRKNTITLPMWLEGRVNENTI